MLASVDISKNFKQSFNVCFRYTYPSIFDDGYNISTVKASNVLIILNSNHVAIWAFYGTMRISNPIVRLKIQYDIDSSAIREFNTVLYDIEEYLHISLLIASQLLNPASSIVINHPL